LIQYKFGQPGAIDLSSKAREEMACSKDLENGNDGGTLPMMMRGERCFEHPEVSGRSGGKGFEPMDVGEGLKIGSMFLRETEN
jgi:hypothetical protein